MKLSKNQKRREKLKRKKQEEISKEPVQKDEPAPVPAKSSELLLARKYEWIQPSNPLYSMHQELKERINARLNHTTNETSKRHSADALNDEIKDTPSKPEIQESKKRTPNKPSLSYLKSLANNPELVQWFDCDAADPEYNVFLKSQPHVVQPPDTWRARSEIPRFNVKRAYTLPQSIIDTGIGAAVTSCGPAGMQQGKLDVDYEKMHTALHSQHAKPFLSTLGEIPGLKGFTERRIVIKHKKTAPSKRLCEALGVALGTEPWVAAVEKHGPAPGFGRNVEYKQWGAFLVEN